LTLSQSGELAHDALATKLASPAKYNRTVLLVMLIENDPQIRTIEELREQLFPRFDWLKTQILAVKLKQIECTKHGLIASPVLPN